MVRDLSVRILLLVVYAICVAPVPACLTLIRVLWPQVRPGTRRGVFARQLLHLTVADLLVTTWVLGFELRWRPSIALRSDLDCAVFKGVFYALYATTFLILIVLATTQCALLLHKPRLERFAARAVPFVWFVAPLVSLPTVIKGAHLDNDGYCHGNVSQHWIFSLVLTAAFLILVVIYVKSLRSAFASGPAADARHREAGDGTAAVVPSSAARRQARTTASIPSFEEAVMLCYTYFIVSESSCRYMKPPTELSSSSRVREKRCISSRAQLSNDA